MSQRIANPGSSRRPIVSPASSLTPGSKADDPLRVSPGVLRSLPGSGSVGSTPKLPSVGEMVFGFRLRQELGRGAFACVFLAEQAKLARRPVVLKISGISGNEPQTLAQLQHTHIAPIHSLHEDKASGLRAVCMPYFGGASLSCVLRALWKETERPAHGRQLVEALAKVGHPLPAAETTRKPEPSHGPLAALHGFSYVRAAAWLVARLADGLAHAHQRGVLHRDVKPSNILLAADGQPMLLDFNLAQNLHSGQAQAAAVLGGTVAYMAPEHLRALATRDPAQARLVDRRADIYSLGMVLYEMLAGCKPFDQSGSYSPLLSLIETMALERSRTAPSLRQNRPDIPWSLESIARKCLAPDPARRYQQAEHLAEDLRCFLEDRPLKHAPELSRVEWVRKWMRRHPRLSSSGSVATVAALLLIGVGAALWGVQDHLAHTQLELREVQAQERKRAFEEGTTRARYLVNTVTAMPDHLPQGSAVCEKTLALYGILDRADWQEDADWQLLAPEERRRLGDDARELLLLLAWARVRQAPAQAGVLRGALALLDRAAAIQGLAASRAIWEDRAFYLDRLGEAEAATTARTAAERIQPASARDHYLLATTYARSRAYARAVEELDQALRLNPHDFWATIQKGICHQELRQYTLATAAFGTGIGLWPEFAWGYFNRGYALDQSGHKAEALNDYTAALERDPNLVVAYLNRGMIHLELKQFDPALADFQKAAALGRDDASLHAGLGAALEGLGKYADADRAFEAAFARAEPAAGETGARIRLVYAFAVAARLPERAREAFDEVLQQTPNSPATVTATTIRSQALYGRAMLLAEAGKLTEAIRSFDRALEAAPGFVEARRFRAILQARAGRFEEACRDINWCLEREPESGASLYAAACVTALAAEKLAGPAAKAATDQATAFLHKAFSHHYGRDKAATDPDLKGIRDLPEFPQLSRSAE